MFPQRKSLNQDFVSESLYTSPLQTERENDSVLLNAAEIHLENGQSKIAKSILRKLKNIPLSTEEQVHFHTVKLKIMTKELSERSKNNGDGLEQLSLLSALAKIFDTISKIPEISDTIKAQATVGKCQALRKFLGVNKSNESEWKKYFECVLNQFSKVNWRGASGMTVCLGKMELAKWYLATGEEMIASAEFAAGVKRASLKAFTKLYNEAFSFLIDRNDGFLFWNFFNETKEHLDSPSVPVSFQTKARLAAAVTAGSLNRIDESRELCREVISSLPRLDKENQSLNETYLSDLAGVIIRNHDLEGAKLLFEYLRRDKKGKCSSLMECGLFGLMEAGRGDFNLAIEAAKRVWDKIDFFSPKGVDKACLFIEGIFRMVHLEREKRYLTPFPNRKVEEIQVLLAKELRIIGEVGVSKAVLSLLYWSAVLLDDGRGAKLYLEKIKERQQI